MGLKDDKVGTLEEAAAKRKERLLELKKRKRDGDNEGEKSESSDEKLPTPQVLFRNYQPNSEALAEDVREGAKPSDLESMVAPQLQEAKDHAANMQQVELNSLAPRKVAFDLKRCIEDKLERLERATDRAIAELIRERLKEEANKGFTDLAAAVDVGSMTAEQDDD